MTARKFTLKNIFSGCVVYSKHHIEILNAKSIGKEQLMPSSLSHLSKSLFLFGIQQFSKEVQKESPKASAQSEIFQSREGFGELEHFDKYFAKNFGRKGSQGKILEFFHPDTLKTTF